MTYPISRRAMLGQLSGAALLATGCSKAPEARTIKPVHIATAAGSTNSTMNAVLKQQKFLESFDLNPEMVPIADGSKIMGGIYSGSLDVAPLSGFSQVFPAIEHGGDLKIISAATLVPLQALFSSKPNIKTLKDLEGKTVGSASVGALVHQLTVTLLRKHSVDVSKIKFVNIGSVTDIFRGVMAGTVDAGTGPASFIEDADAYKVHLLQNGDMSAELPDFTYQAGWTSQRMIDSKRDIIVRVLAAYVKLFRFLQNPASKDLFLTARKSAFPNAPDHEHLAEWDFLQRAKPFSTDLQMSPDRIRYMQQINIDFKVQKEMLPYEKVADMSLAKEALALAEKS
jgi:ABC-type nitrate/sulfonate/bicarbonate transport system substrate-binding protein